MEDLIYSLVSKGGDSNEYYNMIQGLSKDINDAIFKWGNHYIKDYMLFIQANNIEELRSKEEYAVEFMLIGVLILEYVKNARAFENVPIAPFNYLNNLRYKKRYNREKIDNIKGWLSTKILLRSKNEKDEYSFKDFKLLIKWLKATFEFKEEVLRLNNWKRFFKSKHELYVNYALEATIDVSLYLSDAGKNHLGKYTENVEKYIDKNRELHKNKEDIIYCSKGRIQYFFNMVSAEIMNQVYRQKYLACMEKMVFLPTCMRQTKKKCCSMKTNNGYKCKNCSLECNVNKLHRFGEKNGFRVYSIEHESTLFEGKKRQDISIGIIGVACVLNLMSGGWKALRLGYTPQCILLETCGCSAHWRSKDYMTNINWNQIIH